MPVAGPGAREFAGVSVKTGLQALTRCKNHMDWKQYAKRPWNFSAPILEVRPTSLLEKLQEFFSAPSGSPPDVPPRNPPGVFQHSFWKSLRRPSSKSSRSFSALLLEARPTSLLEILQEFFSTPSGSPSDVPPRKAPGVFQRSFWKSLRRPSPTKGSDWPSFRFQQRPLHIQLTIEPCIQISYQGNKRKWPRFSYDWRHC